MYDYYNKKVIVIGGCNGIGRAITESFLKYGATVLATYMKSEQSAIQMKESLNDFSGTLEVCKLDVRKAKDVENVIANFIEKQKNIDVLVNNAGITKDMLLALMTNEDWEDVIMTNLYGVFYTCRYCIRNMIEHKRGVIINIGSISGEVGNAGQANYCASKFGVVGLSKALAKEVASKNIRVNVVEPGFVKTNMVDKLDKKYRSKILNMIPMKKIGLPQNVANAVLFLASDAAEYITGQVLIVDGGLIC